MTQPPGYGYPPPQQSGPPVSQPPGYPPQQGYPQPGHPGYSQPGYPQPGYPPAYPPAPPSDARWRPARIDPVTGTEFGLVEFQVPPVVSGMSTGSLIAGIGSILVSVLVLCFGLSSQDESWGSIVGGAFALLAVLAGAGAITLGLVARRQIRRSGQEGRLRFSGGGTAIAGISCGAAGAGIALLSLALGLMLYLG